MIEAKPLEVIVQVERIYNVQETIADMKAMGGQVGEYALVVERLCVMLDRQEKEFRALNKDFGIAEAKVMELEAEIDTLKTRIKAFVECDGEKKSLCTECLLKNRECHCDCTNERITQRDVVKIRRHVKKCFGSYYKVPWRSEVCNNCEYCKKCESISVSEDAQDE